MIGCYQYCPKLTSHRVERSFTQAVLCFTSVKNLIKVKDSQFNLTSVEFPGTKTSTLFISKGSISSRSRGRERRHLSHILAASKYWKLAFLANWFLNSAGVLSDKHTSSDQPTIRQSACARVCFREQCELTSSNYNLLFRGHRNVPEEKGE